MIITWKDEESQLEARGICFTSVQFGGCVVTNWIFLATQRDQKQNEDWGQNMVDFQSEICQTFD